MESGSQFILTSFWNRNEQLPHIEQLVNRAVSDLFQSAIPERGDDTEDMGVDESNDASSPGGIEELCAENLEVKKIQFMD